MKYFIGVNTADIKDVRSLFREFCLKMHPDKGGDNEAFLAMKAEYEIVIGKASKTESIRATADGKPAGFTFSGEQEIAQKIIDLMNVAGITIELCGSWIWVGGETYPVHQQIKDLGFKFSSQKKLWYWSPYLGDKKRRGRYTMDKIRTQYGSYTIKSEAEKRRMLA